MSQMLSMMKPLPHDTEYPKEFFVKDLEYLPHIVYHILRRTLWPIKGNSFEAKLEGAMKTLVFILSMASDSILRISSSDSLLLLGLIYLACNSMLHG